MSRYEALGNSWADCTPPPSERVHLGPSHNWSVKSVHCSRASSVALAGTTTVPTATQLQPQNNDNSCFDPVSPEEAAVAVGQGSRCNLTTHKTGLDIKQLFSIPKHVFKNVIPTLKVETQEGLGTVESSFYIVDIKQVGAVIEKMKAGGVPAAGPAVALGLTSCSKPRILAAWPGVIWSGRRKLVPKLRMACMRYMKRQNSGLLSSWLLSMSLRLHTWAQVIGVFRDSKGNITKKKLPENAILLLSTLRTHIEHTTALFGVTPADCLCSKLLIGGPREHLCSRGLGTDCCFVTKSATISMAAGRAHAPCWVVLPWVSMSASKAVARTPHQRHTLTAIGEMSSGACNICPLMRAGSECVGLDDCAVRQYGVIPDGRSLVACFAWSIGPEHLLLPDHPSGQSPAKQQPVGHPCTCHNMRSVYFLNPCMCPTMRSVWFIHPCTCHNMRSVYFLNPCMCPTMSSVWFIHPCTCHNMRSV